MPYVFGNDFGGLYGNLLATQGQDASNWFRMADLGRAQEGDQFNRMLAVQNLAAQDAERQRQAQQWNFTRQNQLAELALRGAAERRAEQEMGIRKRESDWRMTQPNPTEERGAEMLFKSALEAADTGELTPEVMKTLPETHRDFLSLHNERARKAIGGQKSDIEQAAALLNKQIELEHFIKQTGEEMPSIFTPALQGELPWPLSQPKRSEMKLNAEDAGTQLLQVQKAAAAIRPEVKAHLRLNQYGWWEPNFRLPWATAASAATGGPAVTAPTVSATAPGAAPTIDRYWDGTKFVTQ